jgi:hypothetical protein
LQYTLFWFAWHTARHGQKDEQAVPLRRFLAVAERRASSWLDAYNVAPDAMIASLCHKMAEDCWNDSIAAQIDAAMEYREFPVEDALEFTAPLDDFFLRLEAAREGTEVIGRMSIRDVSVVLRRVVAAAVGQDMFNTLLRDAVRIPGELGQLLATPRANAVLKGDALSDFLFAVIWRSGGGGGIAAWRVLVDPALPFGRRYVDDEYECEARSGSLDYCFDRVHRDMVWRSAVVEHRIDEIGEWLALRLHPSLLNKPERKGGDTPLAMALRNGLIRTAFALLSRVPDIDLSSEGCGASLVEIAGDVTGASIGWKKLVAELKLKTQQFGAGYPALAAKECADALTSAARMPRELVSLVFAYTALPLCVASVSPAVAANTTGAAATAAPSKRVALTGRKRKRSRKRH